MWFMSPWLHWKCIEVLWYVIELCLLKATLSTTPDIDECTQNTSLCEQLCVNSNGSYFCTCMDGYELIEGTSQCSGETFFVQVILPVLIL